MVIVYFTIMRNFILIFFSKKKKFFIWIKKNYNNLRVINKNLLLSKNERIDKKNRNIIT